LIKNSATG